MRWRRRSRTRSASRSLRSGRDGWVMTQRGDGDIRELRLALVCYGGVSLAVYMHGVTKELRKLVVASRAFEQHPDHNGFGEDETERAYFEALRALSASGTPARVVVDVISGTRSEEHTSELQSQSNLVCRLL